MTRNLYLGRKVCATRNIYFFLLLLLKVLQAEMELALQPTESGIFKRALQRDTNLLRGVTVQEESLIEN